MKRLLLFLVLTFSAPAQYLPPGGGSPSGVASGDLCNTYPSPTVCKINTVDITATSGLLKFTVGAPSAAVPGTDYALPGTSSPPIVPGYQPNQPLSGCAVEYVSGLTYTVGICTYTINGITYTSATTSVTLTTADSSNPRLDVIGVDSSGSVFSHAGTPAANPVEASTDPALELGLKTALVPASASAPSNASLRDIYSENTEWTSSVTSNVNAASTSNPFRGSKDIEFTSAVLTNAATLVKPSSATEDLSAWNSLTFYIRSKAAWPTGSGANAERVVNIFWLNGSTQVGTAVVLKDGAFGFSAGTTGSYQLVQIPVSAFGTSSNTVTSVKFQIAGKAGSTSIGFYLDAISLQGGGGAIVAPATPTNHTLCLPIGSDDAASALTNAQLGPLSRFYRFDKAQTLVEIAVSADGGTPNIIVGRSRAGSIANLTSSALSTASSGGIACSKTSAIVSPIDLATTCSATLQNTSILSGDWLTLVSGTAGGTAKEMTVCLTTSY